jgi:hypothetical protein
VTLLITSLSTGPEPETQHPRVAEDWSQGERNSCETIAETRLLIDWRLRRPRVRVAPAYNLSCSASACFALGDVAMNNGVKPSCLPISIFEIAASIGNSVPS